jgi:hypothetical protein
MTLWVFVILRRMGPRGRMMVEVVAGGAGLVGATTVLLEAVGIGAPRASGFVVNGNLAAGMLCGLALLLLTGDRPTRMRWSAGAILLVGAAATGSRAAGLAVVAALSVLVWLRPRWRPLLLSVGAVLVAVLVWRVFFGSGSLAWHRWRIWSAVFEVVANRPWFGIGAGSLADATGVVAIADPQAVGHYGRVIGSAESSYLGVVVRAGLPTILPLGIAAWQLTRQVGRRFTSRWPLIAGVAIFAAFHDLLSEPAALLVFAVVLGVAIPRVEGLSAPLGATVPVAWRPWRRSGSPPGPSPNRRWPEVAGSGPRPMLQRWCARSARNRGRRDRSSIGFAGWSQLKHRGVG